MLDGDINGDLVLGDACQQIPLCLFITVRLNVAGYLFPPIKPRVLLVDVIDVV